MMGRRRVLLGIALIVAVVAATTVYLVVAVTGQQPVPPSGAAAAGQGGLLTVVDQRDGASEVTTIGLQDPGGPRTATGLRCQRVYQAGGTTVCLRLAGLGPTFEAAVLDAAGTVMRTVALPGVPSRARMSPSGAIASWTVFVIGDSYAAAGGFSTRTGFLDLRTGELVESLETFALTVDGRPHTAADVNYWGVTVAGDDRTFYATVMTEGRRWLVKGDLAAHTAATVRLGPECPSLSPDGTRLAYKKGGRWVGRWELAVLDLASNAETVLPGTEGIDDQATWLDDSTLAYGVPSGSTGAPSVYRIPADGSSGPDLLARDASSPSPTGFPQ